MLRRSTLLVREKYSTSCHKSYRQPLHSICQVVQVMLSVCLVLAGYTLLLHHKLSSVVSLLDSRGR